MGVEQLQNIRMQRDGRGSFDRKFLDGWEILTSGNTGQKWGTPGHDGGHQTLLLRSYRLRFGCQQLPQHILQNAAVGVVERFLRGVDAHQGFELDWVFAFLRRFHLHGAAGGELVDYFADAGDFKRFFTRQIERVDILSRGELQRQDAHADQVRAVDALVAFGDDGGRPAARALWRPSRG